MADHGIVCSMSRSDNVWDNAAMESFFSSLKTERTACKICRTRDRPTPMCLITSSASTTAHRHQQLACQRHDGDAADAALRGTDTRPEPDAQIAVGLIAQPQPGEFDPGGSPLAVAGLADPLIMGHVSALKRARRVADITRELAAIVEVTMEYLANQHRGKLRADRLELMEILDFLGVDMR